MAGEPILTVDSSQIVRQHAGSDWYGRPACEVVNGVVVLVYKSGTAHNQNDGALHIKFSNDYGATWSNEDKYIGGAAVTGFPMNPPDCVAGQDAQEPWLMIAPNGDLLLHMWRSDYAVDFDGTYQSRSTDGGQTWSTPAAVDFVGLDAATDLLTFSTDDHFVYDGVIYAAARVFQDVATSGAKIVFVKSTDNGTTWDYVSTIAGFSPYVVEAGIEYTGSNRIVCVMRGDGLTWRSFSNDMGLTWSPAQDVSSVLWAIAGRHRIQTAAHLRGEANWWTDPNLIMCGFIWSGTGRVPVVWISEDAGVSWVVPYYPLDSETPDAGYSDMFYNPNTGKYVLLTYYGEQDFADIKQYNLTITGLS